MINGLCFGCFVLNKKIESLAYLSEENELKWANTGWEIYLL